MNPPYAINFPFVGMSKVPGEVMMPETANLTIVFHEVKIQRYRFNVRHLTRRA